ncbi:hypothetical protein C8R44DRAFT_894746 [Mycena epipterygia]|nr:hypothetical protein C8R44DRAFT_894746 [Mycena epipterygia]
MVDEPMLQMVVLPRPNRPLDVQVFIHVEFIHTASTWQCFGGGSGLAPGGGDGPDWEEAWMMYIGANLPCDDVPHHCHDDLHIWVGILLVQPKIFSNALLANLRDTGSDLNEMMSNTSKPVRFTPGTGIERGVTMSKQSKTFNDRLEATTPVDDKFYPESPLKGGMPYTYSES